MNPVQIDLPNVTTGDTWEGISIGPVLINGSAPLSALQSCRMYFRDLSGKTIAYGFKSVVTAGFGLINITNATTWQASISAQALPLTAGSYRWDFETTDAAGTVRTLYTGTIKAVQDQSHD